MKKLLLTIIFLFSFFIINAEEKKQSPKYIESIADEVEFSFEKEELLTKGGKTQVEDIVIQANSIKKIEDKNVILAYDKVIFEQGAKNKVEADELEVDIDTKIAKIKNGESYAEIPDAKTKHNKLYYGGKEFEARFPNKAIVKDAYFTTCDNVLRDEVPHYQLKSKKIKVYLEKRVVAYNTVLYIKKIPVFWFPVYITSLKSNDDEAPLFPKFGNDVKFGNYVVWGFDYGEKDSKILNGSLALKLSQNKGFSIDSWINRYTITKGKNYGELKLKDTIINESSQSKKQHDFTHTHEYKNDKGQLSWKYINKSLNIMNEWSEEEIEKFRNQNKNEKENLENVTVYNLKSNFKKIGKSKEYDFFSDIEWTENTSFAKADAEKQSGNDKDQEVIEPIRDVKRKAELSLRKTNPSYMAYGYYKYYDDLNPGNSTDDKFSYQRKKELDLDLKKYKIHPYYMIDDGDTRKVLTESFINNNFMEEYEDENGDTINQKTKYEDLKTITEYDIKKTEEYRLKIGEYKLPFEKLGLSWALDYNNKTTENKLNQDSYYDDGSSIVEGDESWKYFNDSKLIYNSSESQSETLTLKQSTRTLVFGLGTDVKTTKEREDDKIIKTTKEELENTIIKTTSEDSQNARIKISDSKIKLGLAGELNAGYEIKRDWYVEKDIYTSHNYDLTHTKLLYDNKEDVERLVDLKITNIAGYKYNWYNYDTGDRIETEGKTEEDIKTLIDTNWKARLDNKTVTKTKDENLKLELGNIVTDYKYKKTNDYNAFYVDYSDDFLRERNYNEHNISFSIDKTTSLGLKISNEEKFDDRSIDDEEFKNYNGDNLSLSLKDGSRVFTFSNSDIDNMDEKIRDLKDDEKKQIYQDINGVEVIRFDNGTYQYADGTVIDSSEVISKEEYLELNNTTSKKYSYSIKNWKFAYNVTDVYNRNSFEDKLDEITADSSTILYNVVYSYGNKIKRTLNVNYSDYEKRDDDALSYNLFAANFIFNDTREVKKEDIEVDDHLIIEDILNMTNEELEEKVAQINADERKPRLGTNLLSLGEEQKKTEVTGKKEYKFSIDLKNNKKYLRDNGSSFSSYGGSLLEFKTGIDLVHNDNSFVYKYTQSRTEVGKDINKKLHFSSGKTFIGKENHRWGLAYELNFDDALKNKGNTRKLQNYKISIDKEFHCNAIGIGYERKWESVGAKYDYSTIWSLNFYILAFPSKKINVERVKDNADYKIIGSVGI